MRVPTHLHHLLWVWLSPGFLLESVPWRLPPLSFVIATDASDFFGGSSYQADIKAKIFGWCHPGSTTFQNCLWRCWLWNRFLLSERCQSVFRWTTRSVARVKSIRLSLACFWGRWRCYFAWRIVRVSSCQQSTFWVPGTFERMLSPIGRAVLPGGLFVSPCSRRWSPISGCQTLVYSRLLVWLGSSVVLLVEGCSHRGRGTRWIHGPLEPVEDNLPVSSSSDVSYASGDVAAEDVSGQGVVGGSVVEGTTLVHHSSRLVSESCSTSRGSARGVCVASTTQVIASSHVELLHSDLSLIRTPCVVEDDFVSFKASTLARYETAWLAFHSYLLSASSPEMLESVVFDLFSSLFHCQALASATIRARLLTLKSPLWFG